MLSFSLAPKPRHLVQVAAAAIAVTFALRAASATHLRSGAPVVGDTVRGVVYDSLSQRPLVGATVMAEPGGQSALTDDAGRFTIITAERVTRVTAFHLTLDRTGIGSLTAVPAAGAGAHTTLATPSALTAWQRLCPGTVRPAQREGVVFGTVRGSDGATRIAGARVRVSWDTGPPDAATAVRQFEVRTDSVGSYYACGVPAGENAYIVTYSAQYVSGSIAIAGDSLPLRKLDLFAGRLTDSKSTTTAATSLVTGFVRDASRRPVADATVDIDGLDLSVKTDVGGRFRFAAVPTGSRMLLARGVGFIPTLQPIDVLDRGTDEVNVELQRSVVLPGVKVTERLAVPVLRAEFDGRKRIAFGTFLDTADISRKNYLRNVFEGIPSLEVTGRDNTAFNLFTPVLHMTGPCPANVYIDGRKTNTDELVSLPKDGIAAAEIYVRQPNAPARYRPMDNACGVVLVWTKMAFRR